MTPDPHAELAALADGSLPAGRRADAEARVAESPELRAALDRQRSALAALRAGEDDEAPERLRNWLRALGPATAERTRRADRDADGDEDGGDRRTVQIRGRALDGQSGAFAPPAWRAGEAASAGSRAMPLKRRRQGLHSALAVIFVLLACAIGAGVILLTREDEPTGIDRAITFGTREPDAGDPELRARDGRVRASLDGLAAPDLRRAAGWRATGARRDRLGSRRALTVFYERGGREAALTILERPPLARPEDMTLTRRRGVSFFVGDVDGRLTALWLRGGRTNLLSTESASRGALLDLAAYAKGASPT